MARASDLIKTYPDEALLEEVRRAAELTGKPVLTCADFDKQSDISSTTLRRRFGGWRRVLERAGLGHMHSGQEEEAKPNPYPRYTDEDLLDEIRRVADLVEKPTLRAFDFKRHSRMDFGNVQKRLGGWRAALQRAGLGHLYDEYASGGRLSDEQILEEMRRVAKLTGKPILMQGDFDKYSRLCSATPRERFGGWQAAMERAGLFHFYRGHYTDDVALKEVRRVAALLGKPILTIEDFDRNSEMSSVTLRKRFGGWSKALQRAGLERMDYQSVVALVTGYSDEVLLEEVRRVAGIVKKTVFTRHDFAEHSGIHPRQSGGDLEDGERH